MAISIQIRKDTVENWNANSSVILADGEIAGIRYEPSGIISAFKIGNGVSAWSELPYMHTGSIYTDTDISSINIDISSINIDISSINTSISNINTSISSIEISATTNRNNINVLSDKISTNTNNIETVLSGLHDLATTISDIRDSEISSINIELGSLTTTVGILAEASSNLVSLDEINQTIENSISSLPTSSEIQYLSSAISSDISNLTRINGEITTKINTLSSDISSINTITVQYLSSNISSKVSEADVETIISAKADKTTLDTISSYVYGNISTAIDELSLNSLTNSDIINGNNVKIGDNSLPSILSSKLDKDTPFNVAELSVGNLIISGNTISTDGKTYTFVSGESNTIATLGDVTTISTNASKLSGITITPANISDPTTVPPENIGYTDDTVWSISKDGEEEYNTLWAKLDYYNGSYQPTRLPSYNEVRTYVASEINSGINSHNINGDAHPSILSSIDTISAKVSSHYTYIDESFNSLSGYIGRISSDISNLSSHYNDSDEKFSTITSNIRDISSITITVPDLSTTIETGLSSLNNNITQLSSTDGILSGKVSELSYKLDYVNNRVVELDEARWISLSSDSVTLNGNPPTDFDEKVFGFYFSPNDVLTVPESIDNVSLKTLSINTTSASELSAVDIIAIAYVYDNNIFREIGRSSNYINISTANEYIFTFYNCITRIDSVVYIEFKNYATGETITQELPLVLHANNNNNIGVITSLANKTTGSSDVFPTTDIVIDYVADVVVEISNIKAETNEIKNETVSIFNEVSSILSADNIVTAPSANIKAFNSEELSTFVVSSNPRILTTTKLYGNTPEDTISCFPYTGTNEVLLRENIRVTGTPGIGSIKNGDVLQIGDNVTDILKQMLQVELPITAIVPTASYKLYNIANGVTAELKDGRYLYGEYLDFSVEITYKDGKYIIDPDSSTSAIDSQNVPVQNGYRAYCTWPGEVKTYSSSTSSVRNSGWHFSTSTFPITISASVQYNESGITPIDNIGKAGEKIGANTINLHTIRLTPFGYGYMGYDDGISALSGNYITTNLSSINTDINWLKDGSSFNLELPQGRSCKRFIIAYPDSLKNISKIEYVENGNSNYTSNFSNYEDNITLETGQTLGYKVYTYGTSADGQWDGPVTFKITL